jgi:hypothetical protein
VVLAGTISVPFVGLTVKAVPEQIVAVLAAIFGLGFTVTVIVILLSQELGVLAVTVYVAV